MKKLFVTAIFAVFCLGATDPVGCECGPSPSDGGDGDAGSPDVVSPVDASTDATVADANGTDLVGHDGGTDASPADAGDPCEQYLPLIDDQEWNCTISNDAGTLNFTCVWQIQQEGSNCYLVCPGHFSLEGIKQGWYTYSEITTTEVIVCDADCFNTWTCTPP